MFRLLKFVIRLTLVANFSLILVLSRTLLQCTPEGITNVRASPDGKQVAVIQNSGEQVTIWQPGAAYPSHAYPVAGDGDIIGGWWILNESNVLTRGDGSIKVWNVQTGSVLYTLPESPIRHNIYSDQRLFVLNHNTTQAATITSGDQVQLWDTASGKVLWLLDQSAGSIVDLKWSPDDRQILAISKERRLTEWDAQTGASLYAIGPFDPACFSADDTVNASWSPDGTQILTSDDCGNNQLWDAHTGSLLQNLQPAHTCDLDEYCQHGVWVADGTRIVAGNDSRMNLWDAQTGALLANLGQGYSDCTPSEHTFLLSNSGSARQFDAQTGTALQPLTGYDLDHQIDNIVPSADGQRLIIARSDGNVTVWDPASGQSVQSTQLGGNMYRLQIVVSPDHQKIVFIDEQRHGMIWDLNAANGPTTFASSINSAEWSSDSKRLFTASSDMDRIWDVTSLTVLRAFARLLHPYGIATIDWSPDGKRLITGASDGAKLWEADSGALLQTLPVGDAVEGVGWSPDGTRLLTITTHGVLSLWNAASGQKIYASQVYTDTSQFSEASGYAGTWATWSADGKRIYVSRLDSVAKVVDADSGTVIQTLNLGDGATPSEMIMKTVWSPDGKFLLTIDNGEDIEIWEASTGKRLQWIQGLHRGDSPYIAQVAWAPDSQHIMVGYFDNSSQVWDIQTGSLLYVLTGGGPEIPKRYYGDIDYVEDVAWMPDGKAMLTTQENGRAYLWDATTGQPIRYFCPLWSGFNSLLAMGIVGVWGVLLSLVPLVRIIRSRSMANKLAKRTASMPKA